MGTVNEPLSNKLYHTTFGGLGADATADRIGLSLLTATAVGIAAHAAISAYKNPKE